MGECERTQIAADDIVFALSFSDFTLIDKPWKKADALMQSVVNVPLFKCCLVFDENWWTSRDLGTTCFITQNRLQKLYFDARTKSVFFYCDGKNAVEWNSLWQKDGHAFRVEVSREIADALGAAVPEIETVRSIASKYWPVGISYWESCSSLTLMDSWSCTLMPIIVRIYSLPTMAGQKVHS